MVGKYIFFSTHLHAREHWWVTRPLGLLAKMTKVLCC